MLSYNQADSLNLELTHSCLTFSVRPPVVYKRHRSINKSKSLYVTAYLQKNIGMSTTASYKYVLHYEDANAH